ncbi:hemerythrin domain-containing protein [Actinospica sp.]|jgi:hemerythrin superfamily protein|uniref:hemerythrin domain-containing protein n=1 Tax=Actinospica sp. TaxID=1872142 RepID=UPI002B5F6293|nr:hemerythrin domain-containing protein [Actinospica sp.]HWG22514.1 hemerythrin domain-containing protein [Actinospica sp.]
MPEGANAATELHREHEEIEGLAARIAGLGPCPERAELVRRVAARFVSHTRAEERYLYPALRSFLPDGPHDAVKQTRQDDAAERIALSIARADEDTVAYEALVNQLVIDIQRHIEEQETLLLPALIDACPREELNHLGRQLRDGLGREG